MKAPTIDHPTGQANLTCVRTEQGVFWYSYATCVAFAKRDVEYGPLYVRRNEWRPTTGRHLNYIDGGTAMAKPRRLTGAEFAAKMEGSTA